MKKYVIKHILNFPPKSRTVDKSLPMVGKAFSPN